jgi:hypothetical protein
MVAVAVAVGGIIMAAAVVAAGAVIMVAEEVVVAGEDGRLFPGRER